MEKIMIGIKKPRKGFEFAEVYNDLSVFQRIVGGYIEHYNTDENGLEYFCNEEGKLQGLEFNTWCNGDVIVGNIFVVRTDDEGEFCSITNEDKRELKKFRTIR